MICKLHRERERERERESGMICKTVDAEEKRERQCACVWWSNGSPRQGTRGRIPDFGITVLESERHVLYDSNACPRYAVRKSDHRIQSAITRVIPAR